MQTEWDADAVRTASRAAREAQERDPDAALLLSAHVAAHPLASLIGAYDPMAMAAQLARYYHFGDREMQGMFYVRVLAYHREMVLTQEREQREADAQGREHVDTGSYVPLD